MVARNMVQGCFMMSVTQCQTTPQTKPLKTSSQSGMRVLMIVSTLCAARGSSSVLSAGSEGLDDGYDEYFGPHPVAIELERERRERNHTGIVWPDDKATIKALQMAAAARRPPAALSDTEGPSLDDSQINRLIELTFGRQECVPFPFGRRLVPSGACHKRAIFFGSFEFRPRHTTPGNIAKCSPPPNPAP
jgi:hypothetical protein